MAKKILENIKRQIERQNLPPLNTNIQEAPVIGVGKSSGKVPIGRTNQINPRWVRGSYNLNRATGLTVDDFINYSGKINWEIIDGKTVSIQNLGRNSNNLFGIQLFSTTNFNLDLDLVTRLGSMRIFVKSESDDSFRSVFSKDDFFNGSIKIPIEAHQWNTIILTFYAADETSSVYFASDYNDILGWRFLDIQSPDIPAWHTTPLVNSIVRTPEVKDKITLQWAKDSSIGFGGNGIYKKSVIDSGYTIDSAIPATYLQEENFFTNRLPNEEVKWFSYFGTIATLNAGDKISFNPDGENTYEVSQLFRNPKNNIRNPVFQNSGAHWDITNLTEKSDLNARISRSYYNLNTIATNSRYSIVSTLFSITGSVYVMGIHAEQDELLKRPYGLGGYGITPSRWTSTGSIDSVTATRRDSVPYVEVVRSGAGNFRINDNPLYFSTSATYYLYTTASFPDLESFKVVFNLHTGATIFTSGSLYSSYGKYNAHRVVFTPSITGTGHLKVIVPSTLGSTSFSTLHFGQFKLERIYRQQDVNEYIQTQFLKSDKSACATPVATLNINTGVGLSNNIITFGTNPSLNFKIPSDCSFIKLGYVASINNTSIPINFNRNIYGMYAQEGLTFRGLSLFATQSVYLRAASTLSYTVGSQIYFEKFQHIIDRPAQADDGAIVTWDDFDIEDNTQYKYYLDAYDTSSFLNRSSLSTIATLTSGDTTPPKAPTSYIVTGLEGGLKHTWVNPTAIDFKSVKCYSDIGLTTIVFDKPGSANEADLYSEFSTGTALASRYLIAFDVFGNSSATAFATATPLPSRPPQINFSINFTTAAGSRVETNENDWYNRTTVIASFVVDSNIAVASYLFSFFTPVISEQWGNWTNSAGVLTWNEANNHKYYTRYKIRDIYGNHSDIIQHQIFMDTGKPGFESEKKTFWNHNITGGYNGYNILSWNDTFDNISKYQSPVLKAVIERAEITSLIANPAFEENITVSSTGTLRNTDWVLQTSGATISINPDDSSEGSHSLSFKTTAGAATRLVTSSPEASINRDGNYYGIIKYKAVPSGANIASISFYLDGAGDTAKAEVQSVVTSTHWQELKWNYTNTGATFTAKPVLYMRNSTAGDEIIVDEVVFVSSPVFSTIAEIDSRTTKYVDNDVRPWSRYLYRIRPIDAAGNIGTVSHYKYVRAVPDFRDKFRNILDNSSFERTHRGLSGILQADSWDNFEWFSQFGTLNHGQAEVVSGGEAPHGNNYLTVSVFHRAQQNNIHILPLINEPKRYVLSCKIKPAPGVSGKSALVNLSARDSARTVVKDKLMVFPLTLDADWTKFTGTFTFSSPSISHFDLHLYSNDSGKTVFFDEVQLEEKDSLPPTDYYDGVVVRADHIQGNLIRANMLEANVIYADHINVNQINATHVETNTLTATQIKLKNVRVFKKEHDGRDIASASLFQYTRACYGTTTQFDGAIEHPHKIFFAGFPKSPQSVDDVIPGFFVKDYNLSNQGIVFENTFDSYPNAEYKVFSTLNLYKEDPQANPNYYVIYKSNALFSIIGLHFSPGSLFLISCMTDYHSKGVLSGTGSTDANIRFYTVDSGLTGGALATYIGLATLNKNTYTFRDGKEPYNLLSKSLYINGTFYITYVNSNGTLRSNKLYIQGYKKDLTSIGATVVVNSTQLDGNIRQTFLGFNPDNNNIFTGVFKESTATIYYRTFSEDLTEKISLSSINISPYDSGMSIHGGDVVCAAGSLVHWCMTGDASNSHGYCLTDMSGNVIVSPVQRWTVEDKYQTYVWAFGTNSPTYGQPAIKNERGLPLPNNEFMFTMNRVPVNRKFDARSGDDAAWRTDIAVGTIPFFLTGLHVHKNINYAFGSLSLFDIFNRLR